MRSPVSVSIVVATLVALVAEGHLSYQAQLPNGDSVMRNGVLYPGFGHDSRAGGGSRNVFGAAFAAAGRTWTSALCTADTDGDGYTNGQELGDPECVWTVGATPNRTTDITHPAFADSYPGQAANAVTNPPSPASARTTVLSAGETGIVDGYLMDSVSAQLSMFLENPDSYTVNKAKIASLSNLGWTIVIKLPGDSSYRPYYNFTELSQSAARSYIFQRPDVHNNHGYIRVFAQGTQLSNGTFNAEVVWSAPVSIEGFLGDLFCVDRIIALDGANMITEPEKHSVKCALLDRCVPGGFALLMTPPDANTYGPMFNFTEASNSMTVTWLKTLESRQTDLKITINGTVTSNGQFEITELKGPEPWMKLWIIILLAAIGLVILVVGIVVVCKLFVCKKAPTDATTTATKTVEEGEMTEKKASAAPEAQH